MVDPNNAYMTMDTYEAAAFKVIADVDYDEIITVEGSDMAVMVYAEPSKLPLRKEVMLYLKFKKEHIRIKRDVFDVVDQKKKEREENDGENREDTATD